MIWRYKCNHFRQCCNEAVACDHQISHTQILWVRSMHFSHQWPANVLATPNKAIFGLPPVKSGRWGRWIALIATIVAELWLQMAREREIRHMRTAWAAIDDRTLRDIGVSRWKMAYAEVGQAPRRGYESHSAL